MKYSEDTTSIKRAKAGSVVNPLKMSQPLGAALAFMGINKSMPMFHGAQGCTAFGLVLLVRHFKEPIPLQTTAVNEVTAIMGSGDSVDQAILNIYKRTSPEFIGIATTGLTETRGEDILGDLHLFRKKHPEMKDVMIIQTATPDYIGTFQDGWANAIESIITQLEFTGEKEQGLVNLLPGSHLTPGDVAEIKEMIESFGLRVITLPDLSESLYGNQYDEYIPTTSGGTPISDIHKLGTAEITIAIGKQMEKVAMKLKEKTGIPYALFERLMGLEPVDEFLHFLSQLNCGREIPPKYLKWRQRMIDTMLDSHFHFGGKNVSIGGDPDLVYEYAHWFNDMGAKIHCAAVTTYSAAFADLDFVSPNVADLEDMENESSGVDLLVTHSHGRQASERLGIPLYRVGFPIFDRIGSAHMIHVGYRGTMENIINVANIFIENSHEDNGGIE